MSKIKTREVVKNVKVIDKAVVASERMKNAFIRTKNQADNLMDDGQVSPSEYAEDKISYAVEDVTRDVMCTTYGCVKKAVNKSRQKNEQPKTVSYPQKEVKKRVSENIRNAQRKTIKTAAFSSRMIKQTKKSIGQAVPKAASHTVKTTQKTVKTAQRTAKETIKTVEATAKKAQKTAQATAKAAKDVSRVARDAEKAAAATVKTLIAGLNAPIATIVAGGWVAVVVIVVICMMAMIAGSCFGIFFSSEDAGNGQTMQRVVMEINNEYQSKLDEIKKSTSYDTLEMSGSRAVWPQVLSVYSVKVTNDPDNPQEVATVTDEKKQILKDIFWEMNTISSSISTEEVTVIVESDDGYGNIVEEEVTETRTTLHIVVAHKTSDEMAAQYGFNEEKKQQLKNLLDSENGSMWASVLYGVYGQDDQIVAVALSQIGNVGGDPYWSWYGFGSRVEWCACFVSWCANECGYIDNGIIPKYAGCVNGVQWFKDRGQWADESAEPLPGMIIFFDWDNKGSSGPQDGESDHTGIVWKVENGRVHTVEGNSGDRCRSNSYPIGHYEILGYGMPAY